MSQAEAREIVLSILNERLAAKCGLMLRGIRETRRFMRELESGDAHAWWVASVQMAGTGLISQEVGNRILDPGHANC